VLNFDEVTAAQVSQLVADKVNEGRNLDYKRELPSTGSDAKKEFLADVTSFANAAGGTIVFGVSEAKDANGKNTGIPDLVVGLQVNLDAEVLRLEQWLQTGVDPRLPAHRFHIVESSPGCKVLVLVIRQSWLAPHMVATSDSRFYSRTSAGKYPLDVSEIRAAFSRTGDLGDRIRRFRDSRLAAISASETPVPLSAGARLVLHMVPVAALERNEVPDLATWAKKSPAAIDGTSMGGHFNADGYVSYAGKEAQGRRAYVQLFRAGFMEAVEVCDGRVGAMPAFNVWGWDEDILKATTRYAKDLRDVGCSDPVCVLVSLVGVKGYGLPRSAMRDWGGEPIVMRDVVTLPDVLLEESQRGLEGHLRPVLDGLWQTFGIPQSLIYKADGTRDANFRW